MSDRPLHVVFGAGQIGSALASKLRQRGHAVRIVRRSGKGPDGVELRLGDAGDPAFASDAVAGATAVYHCMNPAYDTKVWARELPRILDSLIEATGRAGGRLVVLDNVYMLGKPGGKPLSEDSPLAPCSRKGEIRARLSERLFAAHERGDVRAIVGRSSDFYGPGGIGTYFGDAFWPKALKTGIAEVLINPDTPHTYQYTLDVAAGLAVLGVAPEDAEGRWWMLPAAPAETTRAVIARIGRAVGRELRVQRMSPALISALGLFVPILREIGEMAYQWEEPFVVDDRRFREKFALVPTTLEAGVPAMLEWARKHYSARPRAARS